MVAVLSGDHGIVLSDLVTELTAKLFPLDKVWFD